MPNGENGEYLAGPADQPFPKHYAFRILQRRQATAITTESIQSLSFVEEMARIEDLNHSIQGSEIVVDWKEAIRRGKL